MGSATIQNGAAWAAVLAAGIGCAAFGVMVDLAEAMPRLSKGLNFYSPAGDLSGKSTVAVLIWILAWGILDLRWKRRNITCARCVMVLTLSLVAVGLVAVFPPVMELFARR